MPEPKLSLTINGTAYEGWQNIRVSRGIDQMADFFDVQYTEVSGVDAKPVPIYEGNKVIIKIDANPVIVGFVDDTGKSYSATQTQSSVSGRSLVGDMVDCAALYKSGQWHNAGLMDIAKALCDPFGVKVSTNTDVGKVFRAFCLQDSETAADALARACSMRAVLVTAQTDGSLLITRSGTLSTTTKLKYGANILQGQLQGSWKDRFSSYTIKAQMHGDDNSYGGPATFIKQTVTDTRINRYRPTIIMAENEDSGPELKRRATWERNVRAGRGRRVQYTVQGWYDDGGKLWTPNTLVKVEDDYFRIDDTLLIANVEFTKGNDGTVTNMELTSKEAYDVFELPPKRPTRAQSFQDDGS